VCGKGVRDPGRMATGVHCKAGKREREEEGGHLLGAEGDCKSCRCEGL
jgi:hypothetical protein